MPSQVPSLLYICQNALGDIITTLPSIHFLREKFPQATLDVCVNRAYADIFASDHHVDRVISPPSSWFDITRPANRTTRLARRTGFRPYYDAVVDSLCIPQTGRLVKRFGPARSVGIGFDGLSEIYEYSLPLAHWKQWAKGRRNVVDCFGDLVRLMSKDFRSRTPLLFVSAPEQERAKHWIKSRNPTAKPVIAFNPGAGHPAKRWPMESFLETARMLADGGNVPLFIFGPKETALCQTWRRQLREAGWLTFWSRHTKVQPLAALLQQCALLVTNDCGVMHVGGAASVRVLAIFGPSNSRIWFPYPRPRNRVVERNVRCRRTCQEGCITRHCLDEITPLQVARQAASMLMLSPPESGTGRRRLTAPATPSLISLPATKLHSGQVRAKKAGQFRCFFNPSLIAGPSW
ncbi:MAG TPA: glycosyltransferase family 9 protein [Verrucomicrobiota bacterium]|nr:MAG: ADP-heptose--LPS heptosyltransferase 2 [Verrucomicrobia bacterium ADurb.Bin118]HPY31983.1 glycosyltransferase family 9 protein [Verrucomicrobiota bacterium]HQB15418.1 glycosyltransferase family 9 protein [Verrucomicrobiota bacterium]